jgi:hypothetical protein
MPSVLGDILLDKECPAQPTRVITTFNGLTQRFFLAILEKNWQNLKFLRFFSCQILTKKRASS